MDTLKLIRTRAKQLQKGNKSLKWVPAIKKASAQLRSEGKIGGASAAPAKRKKSATKKRKQIPRNASPSGTLSVASMKSAIKSNVKTKLANALLRRDQATTKTAKKKAGKLVTTYRAELKKYC